ncbi:MAG: hypothetical protein QME41_04810, partial [Actinomycetota bacterium]|nr:hypothetical protein [Actinomycetota bacterium]
PLRTHPLARLVPALLEAIRTDFAVPAAVRLRLKRPRRKPERLNRIKPGSAGTGRAFFFEVV